MSGWRPFEPSRDEVERIAKEKRAEEDAAKPRTCNRHDNCDAADAKAKAGGRFAAEHCHDDCCEDCFGC